VKYQIYEAILDSVLFGDLREINRDEGVEQIGCGLLMLVLIVDC
jgi:hypothetical protein